MVVEEHHGQIVFRQFIFELPKPLKGGTAGISDEQSFLEGEFSARQRTVLIGYLLKSIDQIEVYRERGVVVIDANYEKRFPLFWILDGVMRFDDLVVETRPTGQT